MERVIITVSELKNKGKKIARLAGNRELKDKAVKDKMKSLKTYGQLVPAIIVDAEVAQSQGLEVVDFVTEEEVTKDNAEKYVVLLDANHRYKAYLNLKEEDEEFKDEFYLCYSLQNDIKVSKALAEINIATDPWNGADFVKGAVMMIPEDLPVLNYLSELTSEGYPLGTASLWITFKNTITKKVLVKAIGGKIDNVLTNTSTIDRAKRLIEDASSSLDEKVLKSRVLADWIIARYEEVGDDGKANIINEICDFLKNINRARAAKIEKAKGKRGEYTKEDVIIKILNELWDSRTTN